MSLTKLTRCIGKKDFFLDEIRLLQAYPENCENVDAWLDCGYVDSSDIFISNAYRRILCILFYFLKKKGFCDIAYYPTDYLGAFNNRQNAYLTCTRDTCYESVFIDLFNRYGWEMPDGWNTICDGDSYVHLTENDEIVRFYEKKSDAGMADELTSGLVTITLNCKKFDEVNQIYKTQMDNRMVAEEYQTLWRMIQDIAFSAIVDYGDYEDNFFYEEKVYFVTCIDRSIEGGWGYHVKSLQTMLRPHLLFQIPLLDRKMDKFIKKWGHSTKYANNRKNG